MRAKDPRTEFPEGRGHPSEDAQWIARILAAKDGEQTEEGYRVLVGKYWKLVSIVIASQLGESRDAEDLTQETFVRAFRSLAQLKNPRSFLGWLLRIARNLATDHIRTRHGRVSLDSMGTLDRVAEQAGTASPSRRSSDFIERLQVDDEIEKVMTALGQLPRKYREVVVLRYLKDMDGRTMAEVLGEPEGTIRNRLFRALDKLRKVLEPTPTGRSGKVGT